MLKKLGLWTLQAVVVGLVISAVVMFLAVPAITQALKDNGGTRLNSSAPPAFYMDDGEGKWSDANGKKVEGPSKISANDTAVLPLLENGQPGLPIPVAGFLKTEGKMPRKNKDQDFLLLMAPTDTDVQVLWRGQQFKWTMTRPAEQERIPAAFYLFVLPKQAVENLDIELVPSDNSERNII